MAPRRLGISTTSDGMSFPLCPGFSSSSIRRFGNARRVWPPAHIQAADPSLGLATLLNGARFRARASGGGLRGFLKRAGGGSGDGKKGEDDAVLRLIDEYGDSIGQIGFGGVVGFCSGYAMIKVGKAVAFVIGVGFIVAQGLNYSGAVSIKWDSVERKAKGLLDANNDKKLDKEDAKALWIRLKAGLTKNLPSGGGFAGGFALGLCCG